MQTPQPKTPDWRAEFHRLDGAYAPATIRSYLGDIAAFEAWCAEEGIAPFPAGESHLRGLRSGMACG